ncbi:hypothetical protein C8R44DRAFT_924127 [Mycena epipterygia]|nr:hypothetical protein C8R44DRAFT_924127 [Mycena epipterygia]
MSYPTATQIRVKSIVACLAPTLTLLNELRDFGIPFIPAMSSTTLSLITALQNVKRNKEECIQLMENIHGILYAIINLHIQSEATGILPPAMLDHVGSFAETLHKIHTFLEAQQDGNKIKFFFRQNEINKLHKNCRAGLEEALKVFKVETSLTIPTSVAEIQKNAQNMHQELLELVENLSDGSNSDSSNSFSLLPGQPKIFHGRQLELEDIVASLTQQSAHIAILGAGGIGKTSLARATLHHPYVTDKYEHRFFIAVDSVTTSIELAGLTGSHLGLKPGNNLTKAVVQFLSRGPPCLLVLDNLETAWEPLESRGGVEEFLSLLTEIPHLALIITMRGAERPGKTFIEIADDHHNTQHIDQLLCLTDNVPLAVNLIAHLVDYEGCSNVLARWETEKTSLLSSGHNKQLSLDASITMSLASPRMTPGAKTLLSLLSILPDGLSDIDLVQSNLPIQDLLGCRTTLLRTSLAYFDDKQRLKSLMPIREYIYSFSPPSPSLFHPLCKYFYLMLDLYKKYKGAAQNNKRVNQITSNLGNLHQLLQLELHPENPDLADVIDYILALSYFSRIMGHGRLALMDCIPTVLPQPCNHRIEAKYITGLFDDVGFQKIDDAELLIQKCMAHFHHFDDPVLECNFYNGVGYYYHHCENNISASVQFHEKALSLGMFCKTSRQQQSAQFAALQQLAGLKYSTGDYVVAQQHAHKAKEIAQLSANLWQEAAALNVEVSCLTALGNLKETVFLCQRARELLQLCGMQGGGADNGVMASLAEVHLMKSEYREARKIHIELAQKFSAQQSPYHNAYALLNIAEVDVMISANALEVQETLDDVKTKFNALGTIRGVNQCQSILADLHLRQGNTIAAKDLLQQCVIVAWGKDPEVVSYCLERLADVNYWTSTNINSPHAWAVIYLAQAQKTQARLALHKALCCIGDVFLSEGDEHTAHNLFIVALEGFTYMDVHRSRGDCMLRLGDIAKHRGDLVNAVDLWKMARPLFERSLQAKNIGQIDTRLASIENAMLNTH